MKIEAEDRIIESATELFYRFGIKSITMDDVAKHLAMSKKTLYHHFRDKNEMVMKCCHQDLMNRDCVFKEIADSAIDPIHEMMNMMKHLESIFTKINPNLFYDLQKYYPEVWKMFRQFKETNMLKMIEANFLKGIELKLYRKDINIHIMARLRIEEVEMGFNPELFPPDKFNFAKVQVALLDHFMHGITTIKGHKLINKYKQIIEEE
ncbi:MAG: TetR/AcrR family transcriptional regulator [Bacteroidetes bacterium]|nr:TetR/AcrR family transcriptional regulator [Bacteroidota bacterium]